MLNVCGEHSALVGSSSQCRQTGKDVRVSRTSKQVFLAVYSVAECGHIHISVVLAPLGKSKS